ncbi:MAG: hypothetical protein NVSMB9_20070 [Isosphaeraceae bacterium]
MSSTTPYDSSEVSLVEHCVEIIRTIIAENRNNRRSILQLGYNLGRLSEITRLGREAFWDPWKEPVDKWDVEKLGKLAGDLQDGLTESPK